MNKPYPPIPGYWYSWHTNRLIQVRAKRYDKGELTTIILETIEGERSFITPAEWIEMDLILHSPVELRA